VAIKSLSNLEAANVSAALMAEVRVVAVATVRGLDQGAFDFSVDGRLCFQIT
jgi:hypothetical protein